MICQNKGVDITKIKVTHLSKGVEILSSTFKVKLIKIVILRMVEV